MISDVELRLRGWTFADWYAYTWDFDVYPHFVSRKAANQYLKKEYQQWLAERLDDAGR